MHMLFFALWRTMKYDRDPMVSDRIYLNGHVSFIFLARLLHILDAIFQEAFDRGRFVLFQGTMDLRRWGVINARIASWKLASTPARIPTVEAYSLGREIWPAICDINAADNRDSSVLIATTCAKLRLIYASTSGSSTRTTTSMWSIFVKRGKLLDESSCDEQRTSTREARIEFEIRWEKNARPCCQTIRSDIFRRLAIATKHRKIIHNENRGSLFADALHAIVAFSPCCFRVSAFISATRRH